MNSEVFSHSVAGVRTRQSEMHLRFTIASAAIVLFGSVSVGFAQEDGWKEGVATNLGSSFSREALISRTDPNALELMRIGTMQAWAVEDQTGNLTTALTTQDGLTIIGRIIGPRGEDITAALLATVPKRTDDHIAAISPLPAATPTSPDPVNETITSAPITAVEQPSAEIQAGIDTIFSQAGAERIWFSAGTPKPEAPVVYMLTDPDCPHCQWTIDQMQGAILRGEIDLRIIFTPITGVSGFETSLSILHSDDISGTFMAHMTAVTRGTAAVTKMDTNQADKVVIRGVADNINWMRANRMPGVPFFLYQTDQGARFAFSELPADILTVAQADAASP